VVSPARRPRIRAGVVALAVAVGPVLLTTTAEAAAPAAPTTPGRPARERIPSAGHAPILRPADTCRATGRDLVCHGSAIRPSSGGSGGSGPGPARDPSAPSEAPAFTWEWLGYGSTCVEYAGGDVAVERFLSTFTGGIGERPAPTYLFPTSELDRLPALAPGAEAVGAYGYAVGAYPDGSPVLTFIARCVAPGEPATPPTPPSAVEVWGLARLPEPVIHANPSGTASFPGLTGLDTLLWSRPAPPVPIDAELRGYRITATARPVGWVVTTPDGATHATEGPPTAASPIRFRPERRGVYGLSLAVRWTGTFSVTAPDWGIDIPASPLGTTSVVTTAPYRVTEVRARLVPDR